MKSAAAGLGLPTTGNKTALKNHIRNHCAAQVLTDPAPWTAPGWTAPAPAVTTAPVPPNPRDRLPNWVVAAAGLAIVLALVAIGWGFTRHGSTKIKLVDGTETTTTVKPTAHSTSSTTSTTVSGTNGNTTYGAAGTATCPTAPQASQAIAGNTTALVREGGEVCLFEWRAPLAPSNSVTCPEGWACELDIAGPTQGKYYFGGGGSYPIDAGSFRPVNAYPANDPIHDPCMALANSQNWETQTGNPGWTITAGNFSCSNGGSSMSSQSMQSSSPSTTTPPPSASPTTSSSKACPSNPDQASRLLGGSASRWSPLRGDGWKYYGEKFSPKYPGFGKYDYDGGSSKSAPPAGVVFTFWCKG